MFLFWSARYPEDPQAWLFHAIREAPVQGLPPDIAQLSRDSGVSRHTIYRLVHGEKVAAETIQKIAKALGVPGPGELRQLPQDGRSAEELIRSAMSALSQAEEQLVLRARAAEVQRSGALVQQIRKTLGEESGVSPQKPPRRRRAAGESQDQG